MRPERGGDGAPADLRATPCDVLAFDNAHLTRDSVKMPTAATSIEGTMHEIGTFTVSEGETRKNEEVFSAKSFHLLVYICRFCSKQTPWIGYCDNEPCLA